MRGAQRQLKLPLYPQSEVPRDLNSPNIRCGGMFLARGEVAQRSHQLPRGTELAYVVLLAPYYFGWEETSQLRGHLRIAEPA